MPKTICSPICPNILDAAVLQIAMQLSAPILFGYHTILHDGQYYTFTYTFTNSGSKNIPLVEAETEFNEWLELQPGSVTGPGASSNWPGGRLVSWSIPNLGPGASVVCTFGVGNGAPPGGGGFVTNTVSAIGAFQNSPVSAGLTYVISGPPLGW